MIKVLLNKWFLLTALLLLGLGAFSVVAYKKTRNLCTAPTARTGQRAGASLLWDALPGQLPSISLH